MAKEGILDLEDEGEKKVEQEHQTQAKAEQAKAEAESALVEARRTMGAEIENMEPLHTALGEEGAERRVTFILRLTVDEQGQPRRTEVEHARSGSKETFLGLDVHRLDAFMKACISLPNHPGINDLPTTSTCDGQNPNASQQP